MKKLVFLLLFGLLILPSCQRLDQSSVTQKGELTVIELSDLNGIPLEYGSLISVTVSPEYPRWAQLWFQDDSKTIRVVRVSWEENRINQDVLIIHRY